MDYGDKLAAAKRSLFTPPLTILVAEDDPDDRLLFQEAVAEAALDVVTHFVLDGVELLDTLERYAASFKEYNDEMPALVLLDLNMPRMDGREALKVLKSSAKLAEIPVVILTTSHSPDDMMLAQNLAADAYLIKPSSFEALVKLMDSLPKHCRGTVGVPQ